MKLEECFRKHNGVENIPLTKNALLFQHIKDASFRVAFGQPALVAHNISILLKVEGGRKENNSMHPI